MPVTGDFRKATRKQCKASIAIEGLSGLGKTGDALLIAYYLADEDWKDVYGIDTENRSMDLYANTTFHTGVVLPNGELNSVDITAEDGFKPTHFKYFRDKALDHNGKAIVYDSGSHMWRYRGGILEMVNHIVDTDKTKNKWTAWGVPTVMTQKDTLMELVRNAKIHSIMTIRAKEKQETVYSEDKKANVVQSLGVEQIMMPDFKYEPDLVLRAERAGNMDGTPPIVTVLKSRYAILTVGEEYELTLNLLKQLKEYLAEGTSPDELLAMQHKDYIEATIEYLDNNSSAAAVWPTLKAQAGFKETALDQIPLKNLKMLFGQIVSGD